MQGRADINGDASGHDSCGGCKPCSLQEFDAEYTVMVNVPQMLVIRSLVRSIYLYRSERRGC